MFDDLLEKFLKATLSVAKKVFNGKKLKDIVLDRLTNLTNKTITQGMNVGLDYDLSKKDVNTLKNNIFYFSSAKSYTQLLEINSLLTDEDGNKRTFQEFKREVENLNVKFNKTWLQTEYEYAIATTQVITRWKELTADDPDVLLTYDAVGDGNTTPLCNGLNGTTLPASDNFWLLNTPPNHFKCRSTIARGQEIKQPPKNMPEVSEEFAFNPALEMKIFHEKLSYFKNYNDD